mmetsp:Transcript_74452/g.86443  ORF Transcript_74452/g.86443 Transcript_74452/m.86443 type:complete len:113 (+) Transcript_74452:159-497(+)
MQRLLRVMQSQELQRKDKRGSVAWFLLFPPDALQFDGYSGKQGLAITVQDILLKQVRDVVQSLKSSENGLGMAVKRDVCCTHAPPSSLEDPYDFRKPRAKRAMNTEGTTATT